MALALAERESAGGRTVNATSKIRMSLVDRPTDDPEHSEAARTPASLAPRVITLSKVKPRRVTWLWYQRIPLGKITNVTGEPGLGKSTMMLDLAARVSVGSPMPLAPFAPDPSYAADVIVQSAEDDLEDTIVPRLIAAGADLDRIHTIEALPRRGDPDAPVTLSAEDIAKLESQIERYHAKLLIIDPLMAYLPADVDAHKDQHVRRVFAPLKVIAGRTGCAIVIIRHPNKGAGSAVLRGGGSIGIVGAARAELFVGVEKSTDENPVNEDERIVIPSKANSSKKAPALRWKLVDAGDVARVAWLGVAEGITADALAAPPLPRPDEDASEVDRAAATLRDVLADGPKPVREVERLVNEMTGASKRTIERARAVAGVEPVRVRGPNGRHERVDLRLGPWSTPPVPSVGGVVRSPDFNSSNTNEKNHGRQTANSTPPADVGGMEHEDDPPW
jgi:hypothetical protein